MLSTISTNMNAQDSISDPNMDFLEFLGSWETKEGQWVDPIEFLENSPEDTEQEESFFGETEEPSTEEQKNEDMDTTHDPHSQGTEHD